ncbi:MAG: trypsin-like peptidase domain-containing protein [Fimbriiglobus sp.]
MRSASLLRRPVLLTLSLLILSAASLPATEKPNNNRRDEMVLVVDRVKGAVVNIHSERLTSSSEDPFRTGTMQPQRVNGMGTGIVIDPRGYIVTNYHVVDDVKSLRVRLVDQTNYPARVVALDKESDLAVIKIETTKPLTMLPLGTATDLMLAERVIAIGNAYGYEHTVTIGHVSAMKRDVTLNKEISYKSLIQTQTPINPGNSGGPLINKLGEVVGVNVAIRAGAQNIAFAIPVDTMIQKASEMISLKRRTGLSHGMVVTDLAERETEEAGLRRTLRVVRVEAGTPAADAGVRIGDVIESLGDVAVATSIDLERGFLDRSWNSAIPVRVRRLGSDGKLETADLKLSLSNNQPLAVSTAISTPASDTVTRRLGAKLVPVGPDVVSRVDRQLRGGMFLEEVVAGSPAARAGLVKGDILIGLHHWESLTQENVNYVLNHKDVATFSPLKTFYVREGKLRDTVLIPE